MPLKCYVNQYMPKATLHKLFIHIITIIIGTRKHQASRVEKEKKNPKKSPPFAPQPSLHTDPHHTNNNIHPLALPALELVAPHPILLVVPVRPAGAVHAAPPDLLRRTVAFLLAFLPRVRQVLDDRAVDGELVPAVVVVGRGGLGDERLQDLVDDAVVPRGCAVVRVSGCAREGAGAGVGGDLREAG